MSEALGEYKLHPLEIADARAAAFRASELQREVEDDLRVKSRALADAERKYRKALAREILDLRAGVGGAKPMAASACADVARGKEEVADLRFERDVAAGVLEAARQQAFRRGADRKDVQTLLNWSQHRDLRTDAVPPDWETNTERT